MGVRQYVLWWPLGGMLTMNKIGACQLAVQTKTTGYMVVSTACCYVIKQGLVANLTPYHVVWLRA